MRDFIASQNSERLRQRLSQGFPVREPAAVKRLARSLIDMALVTGIVARTYRAMVLSRGPESSGTWIAVTLGIGAIVVLSMATLHISRFPLRDWLWRAPLFAAAEGAVEMIVSAVLITLHREPLGTAAAQFSDWPAMALRTIGWRVITISIFALILAGIVKWVRSIVYRREHAAWSGQPVIERRRS